MKKIYRACAPDYRELKSKFEEMPYNATFQDICDVLNNTFGMCGFGWKYRIINHFEHKISSKTILFVRIDLYIKQNRAWGEPIPGVGGMIFCEQPDILHKAVEDALKKAVRALCVPDPLDKKTILLNVKANAEKVNVSAAEVKNMIHEKYGVSSSDELSIEQAEELNEQFFDILLESLKATHDFLMEGRNE